ERIFPPADGLTFSTWVCVHKFDEPPSGTRSIPTALSASSTEAVATSSTDSACPTEPETAPSSTLPQSPIAAQTALASLARLPHPVRLLTLVRGVQGLNDQLVCLAIFLHPIERTLIVSTQEKLQHVGRVILQ
ncbi:unnamed protein product, partial [Protopolystoma xenopodis]